MVFVVFSVQALQQRKHFIRGLPIDVAGRLVAGQ